MPSAYGRRLGAPLGSGDRSSACCLLRVMPPNSRVHGTAAGESN